MDSIRAAWRAYDRFYRRHNVGVWFFLTLLTGPGGLYKVWTQQPAGIFLVLQSFVFWTVCLLCAFTKDSAVEYGKHATPE